MKCKNCDGSGYIAHPYCPGVVECFYCDGTGVVEPLTNEEWLKQCTTEQLAKAILFFCPSPCEICENPCDDGGACTYNKALNTIVEWLKQPHKE